MRYLQRSGGRWEAESDFNLAGEADAPLGGDANDALHVEPLVKDGHRDLRPRRVLRVRGQRNLVVRLTLVRESQAGKVLFK